MNLQQGDILVRKNSEGDTLWLSERLVMQVCLISTKMFTVIRDRYKKSVPVSHQGRDTLPITGKSWRWARVNNAFYYDLAFIPNRKPVCYRDKFGDAEHLLQSYEAMLAQRQMQSIERDFIQYLKANYTAYLPEYNEEQPHQRVALAKACVVLQYILEREGDYNNIYKELSSVLKILDLRYIPHHPTRLKEKVDILKETDHAITDLIYLPRKGNTNAEQYNDAEVWSWVMQMRAMPQNFSNEHIIREVVYGMCERTGKKKPSRRWFGMKIFEDETTNFLTAEKRFGSLNRVQKYKAYMPFKNAICAGDCWEMDATRVNMIAHTADDKSERYLYVISVRDVHSGDVLGYSFAYAESHIAYTAALKMAVESAGYLPYELVCDRFPGHNTDAIERMFERLKAMGVNITITHSAQAKAGVERWYSTMQQVVYQGNEYYYGEGIQSRNVSARRSPEYLAMMKKQAKKEGWNAQKAIAQAEFCIEQWRDMPYCTYSRKFQKVQQSPRQLHDQSRKPLVRWVERYEIEMILGLQKEITLRNNGLIRTEIKGTPFFYQILAKDYEVLKENHGKKVVLAYDFEDLSQVWLYKAHGHLLQYLCEVPALEAAQRYGEAKDMRSLGVFQANQRLINERKEADLAQIIAPGEDSLMLGKFGKKEESNQAEDYYLNQAMQNEIKKASGSDVKPDAIDDDFLLKLNRKTY
ncbi:transposase [Ornithobacterium rhinotracheale]|uniref:Mu transposase C-terminal domain-containing protein n=1 Tax=Ornithobacterium rhinotracheale TaxID=28251 RepID=UPI00129C9A7B|nr:Mu transposase C-terminal domain-containing protein [Ornithobacterium rhinotracheale]MRI64601.1 transposase [Ornithobacterium rhinotracheale]